MITDTVGIDFNVQLEIENGTNLSNTCDNDYNSYDYEYFYPLRSFDTFCPSNSSDYRWKLCYLPYEYGYNNEEIDDDDNRKGVIVFMSSSVKLHAFMRLSWAEYVFVSLSLSLMIAKFFPAVHNQIVSRATRLEHHSEVI